MNLGGENLIGLIRVLTVSDPAALNCHADLIEKKYGLSLVSHCIPDQVTGIHDEETEEIALPKIISLGKELVESGCQLLLVSCAADPAVAQLRSVTAVPVIGAGSAAALVANASGKKTGVIGITEEVPAVVARTLGTNFKGYLKPEGINNTNDLLSAEGQIACIQAVETLTANGAEQIQFACTGMSTINLKQILSANGITVPLIDAVEAEGLFASFYR